MRDALGNIRTIIDGSGNITESRLYSPYGEPYGGTGSAQTTYGFTGEPTDSTGFVHLRARYYNPSLGQFMNLDPKETPNRFAYVDGNPVNRTDPSGLYFAESATTNYRRRRRRRYTPPTLTPAQRAAIGGGRYSGGAGGPETDELAQMRRRQEQLAYQRRLQQNNSTEQASTNQSGYIGSGSSGNAGQADARVGQSERGEGGRFGTWNTYGQVKLSVNYYYSDYQPEPADILKWTHPELFYGPGIYEPIEGQPLDYIVNAKITVTMNPPFIASATKGRGVIGYFWIYEGEDEPRLRRSPPFNFTQGPTPVPFRAGLVKVPNTFEGNQYAVVVEGSVRVEGLYSCDYRVQNNFRISPVSRQPKSVTVPLTCFEYDDDHLKRDRAAVEAELQAAAQVVQGAAQEVSQFFQAQAQTQSFQVQPVPLMGGYPYGGGMSFGDPSSQQEVSEAMMNNADEALLAFALTAGVTTGGMALASALGIGGASAAEAAAAAEAALATADGEFAADMVEWAETTWMTLFK